MKTKLITYSLGIALVIAVASPIFAQEDKTEIPTGDHHSRHAADAPRHHQVRRSLPETCSQRCATALDRSSSENLVEPTGFEPVTSSMPLRRSTN